MWVPKTPSAGRMAAKWAGRWLIGMRTRTRRDRRAHSLATWGGTGSPGVSTLLPVIAQGLATAVAGPVLADQTDPTQHTTKAGLDAQGRPMAPLVTEVEKKGRRDKIKEKRRRRGKKAQPLPARKAGADQKYKEFKIVASYDETQAHRLVSGTRGDCEAAGRWMRRQAGRIRLDLADEKVGNVDGSPWMRHQTEQQSLPLDALGWDFYHLGENVHKARREIYGEEDQAGKEWAGALLRTFKHQGYEGAWEQLLPWRLGLRRGPRDAADRLLNYVSERREMICYPDFLAKGWQIGSGPTEATCKTLTARLKGSGMRWDADNAEAWMGLEALYQSGQWDVYWQSELRQAA